MVTLGTQPVGCYTEVRWSAYIVEPVYSGQAPLGHNQLVVTKMVCLYNGVTFLLEHSQLE